MKYCYALCTQFRKAKRQRHRQTERMRNYGAGGEKIGKFH